MIYIALVHGHLRAAQALQQTAIFQLHCLSVWVDICQKQADQLKSWRVQKQYNPDPEDPKILRLNVG